MLTRTKPGREWPGSKACLAVWRVLITSVMNSWFRTCVWLAGALLAFTLQDTVLKAAVIYTGNGNTSFGGAVGGGSLSLNDDGTTVSGTFTRGTAGNFNDALVIYIDSVSGGFGSTSGFNDRADGLRRAISGVSDSGRSVATFASGFGADFAVALKPTSTENFGGLWGLANGDNNSLNFVDSVNFLPNNNNAAATYTFSFNWSEIGLSANNPANSFNFQTTYISTTGFRSGESLGAEGLSGTTGHNPFTFSASDTYVTAVPEPTTVGLLIFGALTLATLGLRRWKSTRPGTITRE